MIDIGLAGALVCFALGIGMLAGHAIGFGKGRRERDNDQS